MAQRRSHPDAGIPFPSFSLRLRSSIAPTYGAVDAPCHASGRRPRLIDLDRKVTSSAVAIEAHHRHTACAGSG